jgi:hypothetical protein
MTFTYQLTPRDFRDGIVAHQRSSFALRWVNRAVIGAAVIAIVLFVCLWVANHSSGGGTYAQALLNLRPVAFIALIYLVISVAMPTYAGRKQYKGNPSAHSPIEVTADGIGLKFKAVTGESSQNWAGFLRWIETKRIFSLYSSQYFFQAIPKRSMTPEQVNEFRDLLKRNIVTNK